MKFKIFKDIPRYVYTLDEFYIKHPGVEPIHWREAKKGEWALTDEGGVCEILDRSSCRGLSGMKQTFVKTITGSYIAEGNVPMDNLIKRDLGRVVPKNRKGTDIPSYTTRLRRDKPSKGDVMYSQYIITRTRDESLDDAYAKAFPRAKSPAYIKIMATRLYKTQRIQKLLKQQVLDGLTAKDVTFGRVVDWMTGIVEDKRMNKQGSLVVPASTKVDLIKEFLHLMGAKTETRLIEDTTWHAKGVISDGEREEAREIGQSAKKTQITQDVGTD